MSGGLFLFIGPGRPAKLQRLRELERVLATQALDRHHVDGASLAAGELLALCRQQPAASSRRLVIVDQADRLDHAAAAALLQQAERIRETACVVLLIERELSLRHPLAQASARAPSGTAAHVAVTVESFPGRREPSPNPFALTDALGTRQTTVALGALRDQLALGKEPLELLGLMAWQVGRWVLVKRLSEAGYGAERIAALTGLRPWQLQRSQAEVADRSLVSLQDLLERCWRLDVEAKRGRTTPALAVEQLVAEICLGERIVAV